MTQDKRSEMDPTVTPKGYGRDPGERMEKGLEEEREIPEWETTVGKIIFYLTCATAVWFFLLVEWD